MSWAVVLTAPEDELEVLSARFFEQGALGVELQDRELLPMPGTPPLPPGLGRCIAHFLQRKEAVAAAESLRGTGSARVEAPLEIAARDWSAAWRARHKPLRVGPRSWVHPPWEAPALRAAEVGVAIDPGMAFGTGSHPTTALCLERLDELLAARPGADVLDLGTGSGVIALLAWRLGAGRICGTDNDAVALQAARSGAELNGVPPGRIEWRLSADPDDLDGPPYRIVVANILLNTLVELAPAVARKVAPGGRLVLSGLLADQGDAAERAYAAHGLSPASRRERDGWVRVELRR